MYGIAGPYIKVTPYLELEVTPLDDPWLTLSAGVDVPAGFSVVEGFKRLGDRFMLELEDFECISVQTKTVLLERVKQNNPPYEPHSPTPANGMTLDTINPILSWTSGDPDGDAVVYDVWFETGDSSPDILVSENQPETYYDPGNLQPNTTYYWQVTAKDTDRRNSYSPIWSFTTGENLVIPGGMVIIPAGTFLMGCDPDHNVGFDCMPDQIPLHEVYLDAYQIDKYEVTNIQYAQCVAAGSCDPPETNVSSTRSSYYDNPTYANYPVIAVFWDNADDYCTWAGKRLPTEAEWEKAARGTTLQIYPWGDSGPTCSLANYEHNTGNCVGDTSEVGSYPTGASPYGVMDMAGNVWEYVADWYGYDYYSVSPGMNPAGPFSGSYKVRRGGDWQNLDYHLLVANRSIAWEDFPDLNSGFRCAAPLE
jgi:formylglycine-generating enzyme required for sulfatase activity